MAVSSLRTTEQANFAHDSGAPEQRTRINVALFSGGSGTQSITEALLRHPQISLTVLINAYDDGHSTGRLRRFIPGMLGPSDVRKNLGRLMPLKERSQQALRQISDYRLPVGITSDDAVLLIYRILRGEYAGLPPALEEVFERLTVGQVRQLCLFLWSFIIYFEEQQARERDFNFTDCALGNLLFAGCYLQNARDFNRAIDAFSKFHEVPAGVLLNITQGENLFLVAEKENGSLLWSEAEIAAAQDCSKISNLYLLDEDSNGWRERFREMHRTPSINPAAAKTLSNADLIIYGPGTQHSSLFPSYMTAGVAEAIAANQKADKIFIGNIHRDTDIQTDDADDLARKLLAAFTRRGEAQVNWLDVVSHFFVQRSDDQTVGQANHVPFDEKQFSFPLRTVRARDWEWQEGRHSGGYVLDELHTLVQARIDVELQRVHHMVSIVIPVLNEESTVGVVLKSLTALDFQPFGLTKEIIVADGGSTDKTVEIARAVTNTRVCELDRRLGRGAAMRLGVEKARGNIIVFFPGDNEYRPEDLYAVVRSVAMSKMPAVFGTRAVKCTDLSGRLKGIYGNNWRLYLTSKYGGMLLSVMTLLLYNRYVSDVLSSIKGFDAHLLRSLNLQSNGIDIETEIVAKLSHKREYMFELPVDYKPRNRSGGKKITALDGIKAIAALLRYRFARA